MTTYRALPTHLQPTADAASRYLQKQYGVKNIQIETEIHEEIDFCPTLKGTADDKHIVCAEVVESLALSDVERLVLGCRNHSLPVKVFVAFLRGQFAQIDVQILKSAKSNGIGLLEVVLPDKGTLVSGAPVSQSVAGLRSFKITDFPPQYREALSGAIETFRHGNPGKGCSQVYDEIEGLTRRIGKKCESISGGLKKAPTFDWNRENWATILEFLAGYLDLKIIKCPDLKKQMFGRLIGITEHRNDVGHKVSSTAKLIERDKQLRTRFENAMDALSELVKASKPLKLT